MTPRDAMTLLRRRDLIDWAADPVENKAWSHARAATRDAKGERVADFMTTSGDAQGWANELARYVALPPASLAEVLRHEPTKRVKVPQEDKGPRPIGISTFRRRLLSMHVGNVLTMTAESVLPDSVIAYRRGHEDAVLHAVMKVAAAVRQAGIGQSEGEDGVMEALLPAGQRVPVRFWAKLDITSFFSSIQRWAIQKALRHHGYPEEFIAIVMVLVRAPVVKIDRRGRRNDITSARGTEQGMAESAVLANLVPFELDQWFKNKEKRLLYLRYSDDIFIGGQTREEVVGAVRVVMKWAKDHNIGLKGVSPRQRPSTLVHDIAREPIELLGVEIDQRGTPKMPTAKKKKPNQPRYTAETKPKEKPDQLGRPSDTKLGKKLVQLGRINAKIRTGTIEGISRMGNGQGVDACDVGDFRQVSDGFLRHWQQLNPSEAHQADTLIQKIFMTRCEAASFLWRARLWDRQTGIGVDLHPYASSPGACLSTTRPLPLAPSGPQAGGVVGSRPLGGTTQEHLGPEPLPDGEEEGALESSLPSPEPDGRAVGLEAPLLLSGEEGVIRTGEGMEEDAVERSLSRPEPDAQEDAPRGRTTRRKSHRLTGPSVNEEILELLSQEFPDHGPVTDPLEGQTPPPGFPSNFIYVEGRPSRRGAVVRITSATRTPDGETSWSHVEHTVPGRPEAAMVRAMTALVRQQEGSEVTFGLRSAFLPKALLQPGKGVRSPLLYARLRELHDAARENRVQVELVGPCVSPTGIPTR